MTSKKFHSKRSSKKKKFTSKKHPTVKSVDRKIHHLAMHQDVKWADYANAINVTGGTPVQLLVNLPLNTGPVPVQRTNNWIENTSCQIRIQAYSYTAGLGYAFQPQWLRIILFWDRQPNGAAPTLLGTSASNSLLDTTSLGSDVNIPRNQTTIERYHILHDSVHTFNYQCIDVTGTPIQVGKYIPIFKKLGRKSVFNITSSASVSAFQTNTLFCAFFAGDENVTGSSPIVCNVTTRIYYKDA